MTWLTLLLGLAALVIGAEVLVRGATRLALATGLSPLVIGLTVVAFGTSSPELAVSVGAAPISADRSRRGASRQVGSARAWVTVARSSAREASLCR